MIGAPEPMSIEAVLAAHMTFAEEQDSYLAAARGFLDQITR